MSFSPKSLVRPLSNSVSISDTKVTTNEMLSISKLMVFRLVNNHCVLLVLFSEAGTMRVNGQRQEGRPI